mmetsp:Transcript_15674/g.41749  ORF Transcript_15674/g.41749 Transcript_15674/m.41749 type:complete len:147 (+) Transcript_15674:1136-1576(+)
MSDAELCELFLRRSKRPEVAKAAVAFVKSAAPAKLPPVVLRISRPPGHTGASNAPHGDFAFELVLPYLAAYVQAGQKADISVSADPFVTFPSANFITAKGIKVVREKQEVFDGKGVELVVTLSQGGEHTQQQVEAWLKDRAPRSKL